MNKNDLKQILLNKNIPEYIYSLDGGLPNEAYCIWQTGNDWEVYYSERGQKSGLKLFKTESEACEYFYSSLVKALNNMGIL